MDRIGHLHCEDKKRSDKIVPDLHLDLFVGVEMYNYFSVIISNPQQNGQCFVQILGGPCIVLCSMCCRKYAFHRSRTMGRKDAIRLGSKS